MVPVKHDCSSSGIPTSPLFHRSKEARLNIWGHLIHFDIHIMEGYIIEVSDDMTISFLLNLIKILRSQSLKLLHHRIIISVIEIPSHFVFALMPLYGFNFLLQDQVLLVTLQL